MESSSLSDAITYNLETHFIGQRVIYYPRLISTMEIAKQEAQLGAAEGTVIITDEQTAGRGRMERIWLSPKGSITLSIILYPSLVYLPCLTMVACLAVVHSIEAVTGLRSQVKWPNDVLVNGKKVSGILIGSDIRRNIVNYAIVGIGVNVNFKLSDFPQIPASATSLYDELGREVPCLDLIRHLLLETERLYQALLAGDSICEQWRDSLVTLGKKVRVESNKTVYQGIAESVARDGSLLLRCLDGRLIKIMAGDVTLRD